MNKQTRAGGHPLRHLIPVNLAELRAALRRQLDSFRAQRRSHTLASTEPKVVGRIINAAR